uniref:Nucleoporin_N domain-containing protein n=1 Tax=Bursaphelenchus xylophilus TaxID=6326 RepID=A0A1I7RU63_BURXY
MTELVKIYVENEKADADLVQKLLGTEHERLCSSGSMDSDYQDVSHLGIREFTEIKHTSLPPELKEQLRNLQTNCAFGIFPEIYRAWMIVDSDLFLWNFEFNKDLAYYDHIENTILKVELVNLRPGVFDPRFAQALVVATTGDLYLLGVGFIDESRQETVFGQIDHKNPNLFLVLEEIAKISLDGVVVTDLACTVDGRVFFSADNDVYECDYSKDRWFGSAVQKVNWTRSLFPNPLSIFQTKEKIVQLAVDDTRHILYSLSDHAKIVVYDLGPTGQGFSRAAENSLDRIVKEYQYQISCDTSFVKEFVSISVIPSTRSLHGYLEAITTYGIRIFFTCSEQLLVEKDSNRFAQNSVRPRCLRAIHFRLPTGNPSLLLQNKTNVYFGKTMNDTTIIALSTAREESALFAFSSMNFTYTNRFIESYILSHLYLEDLQLIVKHVSLFQNSVEQFALISTARSGGFQIDGEAMERESRSLEKLKNLIGLTREFLNLWIILLEHNFPCIMNGLPADVKEQILKWSFADLLSNCPEKTGVDLISALIKFYFGDEAKTETLNNRLASECPRLFTNEDANILKGIELLHTARTVESLTERERSIKRAMEIMTKHAERADMNMVSALLRDLNYYIGIIDMALARAKRVDPRDYAKIAYRKNLQDLGDMQEAVTKRVGVYSIVVDTLNYLHRIATSDARTNEFPISKAAALIERNEIIDRICHSDDEICQVHLFRWLIENGLEEKVLAEPNETLEHFIYK